MSIPQARKELLRIADEEDRDDIRSIVFDLMFRKPPLRRAPVSFKKKLTDVQKQQIEHLFDTFPHMAMREIAQRVKTDQGRVSEHLNQRLRSKGG